MKNFRAGALARAGMIHSNVSRHFRIVERHRTPFGAYWRSYDADSSDARSNFLRFPLGPDFPDHPFPD